MGDNNEVVAAVLIVKRRNLTNSSRKRFGAILNEILSGRGVPPKKRMIKIFTSMSAITDAEKIILCKLDSQLYPRIIQE